MEDYIVSARKYRPMNFDSVVGQRALTTTLKNAIATGKLAHAYLFCGPRGVGKTTCARIFARTINCQHLTPDGEACGQCESCQAFSEQRSYNIHELDAASNNSVEDIRTLIEQVRIPPQIGQYKVFIIDEVHMLSTAAFNAFLKTLEEPPHHAIFILATTEKHKILPTILSRCQIYDFNRMNVNDTVDHLKYVAEKEGIEAEVEALNVIAQKADGGMRDALSIFDQVVSFTGGHVTYQRVIENLNVLDYEYYFRITDLLLGNKVPEAMLLLNEILNKGFDGHHFITGLASHMRDLMVSRDASTLPLLEVSDSVRARYSEQAQRCDIKFLYRAIKVCNDCDLNYRASKNKRLLVELTLIQVAQLTTDDADAWCGRSPKKTLKPIFNQQVAPAQQTGATVAQAPQTTVPVTPVPTQQATPTNSPTSTPPATERPSALFNKQQMKKESTVPTFKREKLSVSIRQPQKSENLQPQPEIVKTTALEKTEEDFPVTESNIRYCWNEFANQLPIEENATAGRMKNMRPKLLNDTTFEVVVDNELVNKKMQSMASKIVQHMRTQLHNSKIEMTVRIMAPNEAKRAYGIVEQYQIMSTKNPVLQKFKETFNLELN
ncbi:MAG: DNA polymerase III subunit gamma/tau [Bacteroidaceae bacterium]|nr:DNA polymerase III subunit gamma/tau [Bacteroidaceae bacterium]